MFENNKIVLRANLSITMVNSTLKTARPFAAHLQIEEIENRLEIDSKFMNFRIENGVAHGALW